MTATPSSTERRRAPLIAFGRGAPHTRAERVPLRDQITGWLFVAPAVFLIVLFGIFPIGFALYMSLYRWRIRQGPSLCEASDNVLSAVRSCLGNYEAFVLGSWQGAGLFAVGFVGIVLAYLVWNRLLPNRHVSWAMLVRLALTIAVAGLSIWTLVYGYNMMLDNLTRRDGAFLRGLQVTIFYAFGSIPLQIGLGLLLAYVLHSRILGKQFFRMIFFLPYITPTVAAAVVFSIIFSGRDTSLANQTVNALGFPVQRWLSEPRPFLNALFGLDLQGFLAGPSMALVSVILLGIWTYTGYNAVIFLAGLGNIPADLYEAARVDGAGDWAIFRYITLPLLSPVTFYLILLGFIGTFTAFNTLFIMRRPEAQGTLDTSALVIFDTFRSQGRFDVATAQAVVLMLLVLALTQVQRNVLEKRVFYG